MNGHDKLKPFGFLVYGCSDGFTSSNEVTNIISHYYLKALKILNSLMPGGNKKVTHT